MIMSYSAHAYRDMSKILADQVEEISRSPMNEEEFEVAVETLQILAYRMADLFLTDNPKGFDKDRFMTDSKLKDV
jgi:hypothetical protein